MSSGERKIRDFYTLTSDQPLTVNSEVWFRSCTAEIPEPIKGTISGKIPEWLQGSLIVNGPGTFSVGTHKLKHLFDGMALLQKFEISASGTITYQNKFVKSEAYTKGNESNRLIFGEFGTAPTPEPKSFFQKMAALANKLDMSTDNTFISVYPLCGEFYAMTETPRYNKINPKTLDTLERLDLEKNFDPISYTAHPHIMNDGIMYNVGYSVSPLGSHYNVIQFSKGDNPLECGKIVAKVPARFKLSPSYMHSFGITENYFIIIETPFTMSVTSLMRMVVDAMSFTDILKWLPDKMTRIVLIDRATGNIKHVFDTDPFYFLYVVNQYEKDDHVLIDICCYKNSEIIDATFVEALSKNDPREAHKFETKVLRFALPIKENPTPLEGSEASAVTKNGKVTCTPELLSDFSCIFPCINYENYNGVDYKFFYSVVMEFDESYGALAKADVKNKTKVVWNEDKIFAWEPQFVPSPDAQAEDDGLIIAGFSYIGAPNKVGIIILDAKDMKEIARCEFDELPTAIPKPLHGCFIKE